MQHLDFFEKKLGFWKKTWVSFKFGECGKTEIQWISNDIISWKCHLHLSCEVFLPEKIRKFSCWKKWIIWWKKSILERNAFNFSEGNCDKIVRWPKCRREPAVLLILHSNMWKSYRKFVFYPLKYQFERKFGNVWRKRKNSELLTFQTISYSFYYKKLFKKQLVFTIQDGVATIMIMR